MRCPYCGHADSKVVDSRSSDDGLSIRRRRECLECGERFTSYERIEFAPLMILKKNGAVEPFDRSKLLRSLLTATAKRGIPVETLNEFVNTLEVDLQDQFRGKNVSSQVLGDEVLRRLKNIDMVAYVRFASVYKDFKDVNEFTEELKRLSKK
jgi:transcriptional repressor NrdR